MRKWLARKLYIWAQRLDDSEWHESCVFHPDEPIHSKVRFAYYGDMTGSWPEGWDFDCSCAHLDDDWEDWKE